MATTSDISIRVALRSILIRNHVDLSSVQIGSFSGVVRLRGELKRSHGEVSFTAEALDALERDARRIRGVRRVLLDFRNWMRDQSSGHWTIQVDAGEASSPVHVST
jgi:hypothetical protein